eukprot:gene4460-14613_t
MADNPEIPYLYTAALLGWWREVHPKPLFGNEFGLDPDKVIQMTTDYLKGFEGQVAHDFDQFKQPRRLRVPEASAELGEFSEEQGPLTDDQVDDSLLLDDDGGKAPVNRGSTNTSFDVHLTNFHGCTKQVADFGDPNKLGYRICQDAVKQGVPPRQPDDPHALPLVNDPHVAGKFPIIAQMSYCQRFPLIHMCISSGAFCCRTEIIS